jgi:NAD(P)H-dependent FMN reductase
VPDFNSEAAAALADAVAEEELDEEMVSYQKNVTGIDHTVFISPKGRTQHTARLKLAIDPPDTNNPHGKTASIAIEDGAVMAGSVPPALLKVQQFIELNREVLLDYWEYRILTDELQRRLKSI